MVLTAAIAIVTLNFGIYLALLVLLRSKEYTNQLVLENLPEVSILIAVRNEEDNIERLIEGLKVQDYPTDKLQILIGDDESEDRTLEYLKRENLVNLEVVSIKRNNNRLKGKMNALSVLSDKAKGKYMLFTDADIILQPKWTRCMVSSMKDGAGMSCGFVGIKDTSIWGRVQNFDLVVFQGFLKALSDLGVATSLIGSNLIVSREEFNKIGGYKNIDFSLVEDVALMNAFKKAGKKIQHHYFESTYISTGLTNSWLNLILQRRRWMSAMEWVPLWLKFPLMVNLFFLPAFLYLIQFNHLLVSLFVIKLILSYLFINKVAKRVNSDVYLKDVLLYEIYQPLVYFSTILYSLLPIKIKWKGRSY